MMSRTPNTLVAVVFEYPGQPHVYVPAANVLEFSQNHWLPYRVVMRRPDGTFFESWAKGWWYQDVADQSLRGQLCRVGAGAYGDSTVWVHPAEQEPHRVKLVWPAGAY